MQADGDDLVVVEPDFWGNPFQDRRPQLNHTLHVLKEQTALLQHLGIAGETTPYDSQVLIAKGCLGERDVYLEKKTPQNNQDSGWFIGSVDGEEALTEDDLDVIYVFELLRERPGLMKALALPVGSLVVFQGDALQAVFNARGDNLLCKA